MYSVQERLILIVDTVTIIENRMASIKKAEDFIADAQSIILLDAISMRQQTIGENLKKVLKTDPEFIKNNVQIDPLPIINFRNLVSHAYELIDYEIIYTICTTELAPIKINPGLPIQTTMKKLLPRFQFRRAIVSSLTNF